jgi:hypothetical protein
MAAGAFDIIMVDLSQFSLLAEIVPRPGHWPAKAACIKKTSAVVSANNCFMRGFGTNIGKRAIVANGRCGYLLLGWIVLNYKFVLVPGGTGNGSMGKKYIS